jgi:hypothetical protein
MASGFMASYAAFKQRTIAYHTVELRFSSTATPADGGYAVAAA